MFTYRDCRTCKPKIVQSKDSGTLDTHRKINNKGIREQNSWFDDLDEYVGEVEENQVVGNLEKYDFKLHFYDDGNTSTLNEPVVKRAGKGRPPKRYDRLFECDLCEFVTDVAKYFNTHMSQTHQVEQPRIFKCMYCTEAYVEERFLHEHIKYVHYGVPRRRQFLCTECGKTFPKQFHLMRHSYVHKPDEKPFLCECCPRRFTNQSSLVRHIEAIHTKCKPHECNDCGKAFGHIYGLKAHKNRVHCKGLMA